MLDTEKGGIQIDPREPEAVKQQIIDRLVFLRDDWLPKCGSRKHSRSDGRATWYVGLATDLHIANNYGLIPPTIQADVNLFLEDFYSGALMKYAFCKEFDDNGHYHLINKGVPLFKKQIILDRLLESYGVESKNSDPKSKFIEIAMVLLFDYSDFIPQRKVSSRDGMYKVRTTWFVGINCTIQSAVDFEVFNPDAQIIAQEYIDWFFNVYGKEPNRQKYPEWGKCQVVNTRDDIEKGNKVLEALLKSLDFMPLT